MASARMNPPVFQSPEEQAQFLRDLAHVLPAVNLPVNKTRSTQGEPEPSILTYTTSSPEVTAAAIKSLLKVENVPPPDTQPISQQQRRKLHASSQGPWTRGPNTALYSPNAESLVARSLLKAHPSPFRPPTSATDLTEINWDEEGPHAHWPLDDETIFYRQSSLAPSAEAAGRRQFFDMNIVMPMVIPGSEIRVLNSDGENYYHLASSNPGAHLLFGREAREADQDQENGLPSGELSSDDPRFAVKPPLPQSEYPAVCDIWASFLNVHLGSIRNCRADQVQDISALFLEAFNDELTHFMVPVTVDARGIYPSTATQNYKAKNGPAFQRYETRGSFLSDNDRKRFRILRRRLKVFVLRLWERFGVICEGPKFDVALSDNCKTGSKSKFSIEIRRYGALTHPQLVQHLEKISSNEVAAPIIEIPGLPAIAAQTRVIFNEIRLELAHARSIDPRWPKQWVLARRMPNVPTAGPRRIPCLARHVFCDRVEMPRIVYEFNEPRQTLLQSRFAPLYLLAEVGAKEEAQSPGSRDASRLNASAVPFFPLSTVISKLTASTPWAANGEKSNLTAWDRLLTSASLTNSSADGAAILARLLQTENIPSKATLTPTRPTRLSAGGGDESGPFTQEPCKFFTNGSCARGKSCYFLHPADPRLEATRSDVRHLSPANPLYF